MALTTFGSIMGFAAGLVRQAEEAYQTGAQKTKSPALREILQDLLREAKKNRSLMETTRREQVTEMILEPITGLRQEDYERPIEIPEGAADAELLRIAREIEEGEMRFFDDCAAKVPLPEAARILRKAARRKESNLARLQALQ
jgi:hypothetical protein